MGAYSPDRTHIACISSSAGELIVSPISGPGDRVLVPDQASNPVWSPTGDRIAFSVAKAGSGRNPLPPPEIRIVDVASGTVTSVLVASSGYDVNVIGFSPDGGRILFSEMDAGGTSSLWSVRTDGSDAQLLVQGSGGGWQP